MYVLTSHGLCVCPFVCLCTGHTGEPWKNGWTNQDAVLEANLHRPKVMKVSCIRLDIYGGHLVNMNKRSVLSNNAGSHYHYCSNLFKPLWPAVLPMQSSRVQMLLKAPVRKPRDVCGICELVHMKHCSTHAHRVKIKLNQLCTWWSTKLEIEIRF